MFRVRLNLILLLLANNLFAAPPPSSSIVEEYPDLKKFTFQEPHSDFYLGFGISPITIMRNKVCFSANVFQLAWLIPRWDLEIINVSFGFTVAKDNVATSRHFTIRTFPKVKITEFISIGPLFGLEFVSFPQLNARTTNGLFQTPAEPFSSVGFVYGGGVSQVIALGEGRLLRLNEAVYKQTYATDKNQHDWTYVYNDNNIQSDRDPIKPGFVFMIEISLLF